MNTRCSRILRVQIGLLIWLYVASSLSFASGAISGDCTKELKDIFSMLPGKVGGYEKAATFESFSPVEASLIQRTTGHIESNKEGQMAGKNLEKENNYLVLIGASFAEGWELGEVAGMKVINKGISGEQSFEMLSRFNEDVIALAPKAVIIWGFINDIHRSDRSDIDRTIERAKTSITEMVTLAKNNEIIPILATELTIRPMDSWKETLAGWIGGLLGKANYQDYVNQHVMIVNHWLRDYAHQHNLLLLDLQPIVSDENGRRRKEFAVKDGSHISPAGYERLTEHVKSALDGYKF